MGLQHTPAVVSKPCARSGEPVQYLALAGASASAWTSDLATAAIFESMTEAARMALRLPGSERAFGLPLRTELITTGQLH